VGRLKRIGSRLTLKPVSLPDRSAAVATAASRRAFGALRACGVQVRIGLSRETAARLLGANNLCVAWGG